MKRIFIGGIGRSGTSIMLHVLYRHGDIYAVPVETKFLVEEDGFADLITALTTRFSPTGSSAAFERFKDLMFGQVTGRVDSKFRKQEHLPSDVFPDYARALEDFMHGLSGQPMYFPDQTVLLDLTRRFIASLFDAETVRSDKSAWVEKTPSNYWRLGFLRELWPDCYFIHAIRDPRAIFLSLLERGWLTRDVDSSLEIFAAQMMAFANVRRSYAGDPRLIEVRLEDLVARPRQTLDQVAGALELTGFTPCATAAVVRSMDTYYASKDPHSVGLTACERRKMHELLLPAVTELGYPRDWQPALPRPLNRS